MNPIKIRERLAEDFPARRFNFALFDCDTQIGLVATNGRSRCGIAPLDNAELALRAWLADQENTDAG